MVVNLGDKPLADFTQPIEMLKDCHRRIEHFIDVLGRVEAKFGGGKLDDEGRRALESSLDYFANFAPRHTADEESSLFPRMRASTSADARAVMADLDRLESEHRISDDCHRRVDELARHWLTAGQLDEAQRQRFQQALEALRALYTDHIRLEEQRVFAVASALLDPTQLREIGEEMRQRRSLSRSHPADSSTSSCTPCH